MGQNRNPAREIAFALIAGALFAGGLVLYLKRTMVPPAPIALVSGPPAGGAQADPTPELTAANELVKRFVGALRAGDHAGAYALMAAPYRDSASLDSFRARCQASPFLAGAQRGAVLSTRETRIGSASGPGPRSMLGRGVIESDAGRIDASFTFLVGDAGPSILVLALGGVPVLDGVSGAVGSAVR